MPNLGELSVGIKSDKNSLKKATKEIKKEFNDTSKQIEKDLTNAPLKGINKLKNAFKGLGGVIASVFALHAIWEFTKSLFSLTSQLERAKKSFETLLGSEEDAVDMLDKLDKFASKTPFNKLELIKSTQKLLGFGFAGKQVLPIMKSVGDGVSAIGGNQETLNGIILALGQIKAKGKLSAEELMQMAERGLPVFEILEDKLNLTKEQIGNIGNAGITASEAIPALLEGLNERFAGSLEKQAQTLDGKWSNIVDTIQSKLAQIGDALGPVFNFILDKISLIVPPILNFVLFLVKTFKAGFDQITKIVEVSFKAIIKAFEFLKKNAEQILKILVASFLSALIIIKRAVIAEFVKASASFFIASMKKMYLAVLDFTIISGVFIKNIKVISKTLVLNTLELAKNTKAKVLNSLATSKLAVANLRGALSFKALGKAIFGIIKKVVLLASRFFFIATIVVTVVVAIFKNWDTLKEKLKPVFEFIGKIGQMAPQLIADAWGVLVDVVTGAIKMILGGAEKIVKALNHIPGIDIDTEGIENAVKAVDDFGENMKFTAKDVKGAFNSIASGAGDALNFVTNDMLGLGELSGDLDDSVFDIKNAFGEIEDEMQELSDASGNSASNLKKSFSEFEDKIKELEQVQKRYKENVLKFNEQIKDSLRGLGKELENNKNKLNETLKNIEKARNNDLKNNSDNRDNAVAKEILNLEKELEENKKSLQEILDDYTLRDNRGETSSDDYHENEKKKTEYLEQIETLENSILEAKKLVNEETLNQLRNYAKLSEIDKIIFDSKKQEDDINKKADEKKQEAEKEAEIEQEKIENLIRINKFFLDQKYLNEKTLEQIVSDERFKNAEKEVQDLILKLAREKVELSLQKDAKIALEEEVNTKIRELSNVTTSILKNNADKMKAEYRKLIEEINKAIERQKRLNALRQSGGTGGESNEEKNSDKSYAFGGYTGDGGKYEVAGKVHKGEYVINQEMLQKMPHLVANLENLRTGNTQNNYSKNVNVDGITVNSELDLELFFDDLRFRL